MDLGQRGRTRKFLTPSPRLELTSDKRYYVNLHFFLLGDPLYSFCIFIYAETPQIWRASCCGRGLCPPKRPYKSDGKKAHLWIMSN